MYNNGTSSDNDYVTYDGFTSMLSAYVPDIVSVSPFQTTDTTTNGLGTTITTPGSGVASLRARYLTLVSDNPITNPSYVTANDFNGHLAGTADIATQVAVNNTNANAVHYLNFTNNHTTGNYALQATDGISCNPNDNSITATTFIGALSGNASTATSATTATNVVLTDDNTNGTYYIPFSKTVTGNDALYVDSTTGPLSYNPSTSTLTATTFSGSLSGNASTATSATSATNATNASNIVITSDNTSGTYYVPFSKLSAGTNPLYVDDTTGPLTYNPSTAKLSCGSIQLSTGATNGYVLTSDASGNASWQAGGGGGGGNASTITLTSDNTSGTYYIPFSKTVTGNDALYVDNTTGPLTYDPNAGRLTIPNLTMTTGAGAGYVMTSNASGQASWQNNTINVSAGYVNTGIPAFYNTSGALVNCTSIVLTPGTWQVFFRCTATVNQSVAATITFFSQNLATTNNSDGNFATGRQEFNGSFTTAASGNPLVCPLPMSSEVITVASNTTYYLNSRLTWSGATTFYGGARLFAVRLY